MPTLPLLQRIERVSAPAAEPITAAEAKAQMRVEHTDDDTLIDRLVDTAIDFVDVTGSLGKAMITQTWGEWFAPNPGSIVLSLGPVQSVSAIKYYDTDNALQTATLSNFHVLGTKDQTVLKPKSGYSWPTTFLRDDAIKIEYVVGYGDAASDVPQTVRHALMMLVAHLYENRELSIERSMSQVPFGFEALIERERSSWYG